MALAYSGQARGAKTDAAMTCSLNSIQLSDTETSPVICIILFALFQLVLLFTLYLMPGLFGNFDAHVIR